MVQDLPRCQYALQVATRIASLSLFRPLCFIGCSSSAGKLELVTIPTVAPHVRILVHTRRQLL
jgi:hypothetical protein